MLTGKTKNFKCLKHTKEHKKSYGILYVNDLQSKNSANIALDNAEFCATVVCLGILNALNLVLSVRPTGIDRKMCRLCDGVSKKVFTQP